MTRINCVPPQELSRQHLLAEWRELPRVFALAARAAQRPSPPFPAAYTLGTGHVRFFYPRLGWCTERWRALREEMLRRGYAPGYDSPPRADVPPSWHEGWSPDAAALALNRSRIAERTKQ